MGTVTFFLTTGRSGTQSLAHHLGHAYSDLARVVHEPIGAGYKPKRYLRQQLGTAALMENPRVKQHIGEIERTLLDRDYIEVGWPSFAWAPFLDRYFSGRVRFVHLVRNPVRVALSLTTHGFYQPAEGYNEYIREAQLDPAVPGVRFSENSSKWREMTPYEKCLFQWLEINAFATEMGQDLGSSRFRRFRLKDLADTGSRALRRLVSFLGLPPRKEFFTAFRARRIDPLRTLASDASDWRLVYKHPDVVQLAAEFGYRLEEMGSEKLRWRYSPPGARLARKLSRRLPARLRRPLRSAFMDLVRHR